MTQEPRPDPSQILAPLDSVFLPQGTMDAALVAFAVPDLVHGGPAKHHGGIISGHGGVGKTYFMECLEHAYRAAGAYARKCVIADVSDKFVGTRAKDLDKILKRAASVGKKKGIPSLVWFDEATSLVLATAYRGNNDWELGGIDTLKAYIGNKPYLVFGATTNELNSDRFEPQLVRPGRLTPMKFERPGANERRKMWEFYTRKYRVCDVNSDALGRLVAETEHESGAFIAHFCETYASSAEAGSSEAPLLDRLRQPGYVHEKKPTKPAEATVFQVIPRLQSAVRIDRHKRTSRGESLRV